MGMGDLFKQAVRHDGYATKESGEDIYWKDVDVNKLQASRVSNPLITSWTPNNPSGRIPVNNSKGAIGGMVHPSTAEVRQSLKIIKPTEPEYLAGFSQSAMEAPIPSSQGLSDPMPQEVVTPVLQESYGWLGKPASDDDNQSSVGQIS